MPFWAKLSLSIIAAFVVVLWVAQSLQARAVAAAAADIEARARQHHAQPSAAGALEGLPPPLYGGTSNTPFRLIFVA